MVLFSVINWPCFQLTKTHQPLAVVFDEAQSFYMNYSANGPRSGRRG
jgi:hypothetical protein